MTTEIVLYTLPGFPTIRKWVRVDLVCNCYPGNLTNRFIVSFMEFVVDKVSEDSFYENLLIGLPKILEKLPGVNNVCLERSSPVPHSLICAWEQKHGVLLPEDLRSFYASGDGLLYTYDFSYRESESPEDKALGKIQVNPLNDLIQIYGYEISANPGVDFPSHAQNYELKLGPDSKIFEMVHLDDLGRVVLVYINHRFLPTIWLHNASMQFYFLADNFTTYLRMSIHHLGIPNWQFSFTPDGIPEWSEMIFRLLAPAIFPLNNHKLVEERKQVDYDIGPVNKIDWNIFKSTRPHHSLLPVNNTASTPGDDNLSPDLRKKVLTKSRYKNLKKSHHQKK